MIEVGQVLVSTDVITKHFLCDLKACKGACCVEGDAGAPLTLEEVAQIEDVLPEIWDDLDLQARKVINKQGVAYVDVQGDLVTSIVRGKDCVFTCYGEEGCCYCAIEKAYRAGKVKFQKPISCHLYPIRVKKIGDYYGLNYDQWDVCKAAVVLGNMEKLPVYKFLKEPLIKRFGEEWYKELETVVEELKRQNISLE